MAKRSAWRRTGPSAVAQHRLAEAIRRNRAELENEVTEGLLRSELYRETGRPAAAAEVIEEQRSKIVAFEGRVREAIAAAAVEAEAEAVLAQAEAAATLHERPEPSPSRVPQLVAAAIAAIASMAVLTAVDGATEADGLRAAVRIDATDQLASPSDTPSRFGPIDGSHDFDSGQFDYLQALHRPTPHGPATVDDPETRRWLLEQEALLEALGMNVRVRGEVMRELEGLVSTLAPGTPLPDEVWLEVLSAAAARAQAQAQAEGEAPRGTGDGDAAAEPEARSEPEPGSGADSGSGDGSWFPTDREGEATGEQDRTDGGTEGDDGQHDPTAPEDDSGTPPPDDDPDDDGDGSAGGGGLLARVAQDDEG